MKVTVKRDVLIGNMPIKAGDNVVDLGTAMDLYAAGLLVGLKKADEKTILEQLNPEVEVVEAEKVEKKPAKKGKK